MMAVSPFDGANRIRFKGSLEYQTLSPEAPPKAFLDFQIACILRPF
jgi:hypothetical protein